MTISGTFEFHLTVSLPTEAALIDLEQVSSELGLKLTVILLESGQHPHQVMAGRYIVTNCHNALSAVQPYIDAFQVRGHAVTRVKIESLASNAGLPQDRHAKALDHPTCYWEFHYKVELDPGDMPALRKLAGAHGGLHLSRNVYKRVAPGVAHVFLTLREFEDGRVGALERQKAAADALEKGGYKVMKKEREFVVHDSNLGLDAGWECIR
ncbi:hypothetical protein HK101_011923 [Irineochytrium annulatum]|nr:hypothetical protein HK101_011923 [Irineochytrium annulatum]